MKCVNSALTKEFSTGFRLFLKQFIHGYIYLRMLNWDRRKKHHDTLHLSMCYPVFLWSVLMYLILFSTSLFVLCINHNVCNAIQKHFKFSDYLEGLAWSLSKPLRERLASSLLTPMERFYRMANHRASQQFPKVTNADEWDELQLRKSLTIFN